MYEVKHYLKVILVKKLKTRNKIKNVFLKLKKLNLEKFIMSNFVYTTSKIVKLCKENTLKNTKKIHTM